MAHMTAGRTHFHLRSGSVFFNTNFIVFHTKNIIVNADFIIFNAEYCAAHHFIWFDSCIPAGTRAGRTCGTSGACPAPPHRPISRRLLLRIIAHSLRTSPIMWQVWQVWQCDWYWSDVLYCILTVGTAQRIALTETIHHYERKTHDLSMQNSRARASAHCAWWHCLDVATVPLQIRNLKYKIQHL